MNRPNSCLLVRFSFSLVILCVTVCLLDLVLGGLFYVILHLCAHAFVVFSRPSWYIRGQSVSAR